MRKIKKIDCHEIFAQTVADGHRIGEDVFLLDGICLDSSAGYEFVSTGNIFFEIQEGAGSVSINGVEHTVNGPCLAGCFQGQIVRALFNSGRTVLRAAFFSDRFVGDLYHSSLKFSDIRSTMVENPVIGLDTSSSRRLDLYARTMREIAVETTDSDSVISARYETLSLFFGPLQKCFKVRKNVGSSRKPILSSEFFGLLKEHFRTEHQLKYYADRMNITDRYLYSCVVSATGKAPSYWVDCYLLLEAKRLLVENVLSINQISETLGFSGPSQFGKFFKKHEGMSAREYRTNYSK